MIDVAVAAAVVAVVVGDKEGGWRMRRILWNNLL
jgi:hypothetical protein